MSVVVPDELQATYDPETERVAFWGAGGDPGGAMSAGALPEGAIGSLRLALPAADGSRVVPGTTAARFLPVDTAVEALRGFAGTGDSLRAWCQAAELVAAEAPDSAYRELARWMPVAAHAVLSADEQAIPTAGTLLAAFREAVARTEAELPPVRAELRDYQRRGVSWLRGLADRHGGGILADEMGLGKTLQAICLLLARDADRPHLVVCPTSLLRTWERELARFAPQLPVVAFHGASRRLDPWQLTGGAVVVTSYAVLRRESDALCEIGWDVLVADEAQQIKNAEAQATRAARRLDARVRLAMTGTPVENRLADLWSIMSVTNPGLLGSRSRFRTRFAIPIEQRRSTRTAQRLAALTEPLLLRRTKADVAPDLPPKHEVLVTCTLTREQAALYRRTVDEAFDAGFGGGIGRRGRVLALLTHLKQICNHPAQLLGDSGPLAGRSGKLDRAAEMIAEIVDAGQRALVFTQYKAMGEMLVRRFSDELGTQVPFLHGGLSVDHRDRLVTDFQEDDHASPVLVLSLRAAGYGLTLTRAGHVLHYDRWWNPAVEDQASDRAHRIGQRHPVTVHTLLTNGTVEEHIARLHEDKRGLAGVVTGGSESALADLPDRDLRAVLELTDRGEDA